MDLRSNPDSTIRDMRRYLIEKLYFEMHDLGEKNLKLRSGDMEAFTAAYDSGCVDDYMDKLDLYGTTALIQWEAVHRRAC